MEIVEYYKYLQDFSTLDSSHITKKDRKEILSTQLSLWLQFQKAKNCIKKDLNNDKMTIKYEMEISCSVLPNWGRKR